MEDSGIETFYLHEESLCILSTKDYVCVHLYWFDASITPGECSVTPVNFIF